MEQTETKVLLLDAVAAARQASVEILEVYEGAFSVEYKEDNSPLTIADKRAHNAISKALKSTGIPILSEEGRDIPYGDREQWRDLWIVDPLDGTKEFVKQNGEFTVNIALVERGVPVLGVIFVPVEETLYFAGQGLGAYRLDQAAHGEDFESWDELTAKATPLPEKQDRPYTMVGSRSHMNEETAAFFDNMRKDHPDLEIVSRGSSLKICMVAEGSADVYPRFAPTMEWDTAAGHAIAKESGLEIYQAEHAEAPLEYNKADLLNPWFIVKQKA
ncbi:MAG: 3'(2'),5'-bisphosphate nucleotidase CysQ [Schleiferiaceae bacterium]|nr:3'(2'),5'-bisphosphate nucleotidase CysQ [Schleiferiaceae bacterium]